MIEASVNWTDKDRFVGAATSRHSIVMDAAAEKTANSPMELVLLALCGCTASDVVGILRKKREPFTGLEVRGARRESRRLSRRLYVDSLNISSFAERCRKKPWKTRSGSRKKSTARFPPCWRKRRRSPTPSSTLREGPLLIRCGVTFISGAQHFSGEFRRRSVARHSPGICCRAGRH